MTLALLTTLCVQKEAVSEVELASMGMMKMLASSQVIEWHFIYLT